MGDLVPISAAPSYDDGGVVEQRVTLTRAEFGAVARGEYPDGRTPDHGPPRIVDHRGRNNPAAQRLRAEREQARRAREAQAEWARQAAGTLWWMAQGQAQRGQQRLAQRTLDKREELVVGAVREGILAVNEV